MKISFYGAAGEVTGSNSLLEAAGHKILIDCGMWQGSEFNAGKNFDPLPYDMKEISAVLVTHAHLDHVGRLPLLIKNGYTGSFYATPATVELAQLIMEDALDVMSYDHHKFGKPILFKKSEIDAVMRQFKSIDYRKDFDLLPGVIIKLYDAGHIFGSAFIEIQAEGKKVIFSGDIGNDNVPILKETDFLPGDIDLVVCESTYGNRLHEAQETRQQLIENMVTEAIDRGGVLMIPSFSLERTQELIYDLNNLIDRKHLLPRVPIYLDSPLAIKAIDVYRKYSDYYDEEAGWIFQSGDDLFQFPGLMMTSSTEDSKKINDAPSPKIIIAGSGMMNGGRIMHHAQRYLNQRRNTLLIIGYQARGTLGRRILNGETPVNVDGKIVPVNCQVKALGALSAHGDQKKLLVWLTRGNGLPKRVYLNHGEPEGSEALKKMLNEIIGVKAEAVTPNLTVEV
jgi:metallo-beta-lactamase family protein